MVQQGFDSGHIPVLGREVLDVFTGQYQIRRSKVNKYRLQLQEPSLEVKSYLDGTFGRGGHLRLVQEQFPGIQITALDRDQEAIDYAKKVFSSSITKGEICVVHADFADFSTLVKEQGIPAHYDLILLDLGVSSPQLDCKERGFSFYQDGPLDMRMDQSQELSAVEVVNEYSKEKLFHIFRELGEIRSPRKVIDKILEQRENKKLSSTLELSELIERVDGWKKKGHHPATLYFMALRMEVNAELDAIRQVVPDLIESLNEGGRLAIISFHSLEDRLIKKLFSEASHLGEAVNRKAIVASEEELKLNPRARSAKLRAFQKGFPKEMEFQGGEQ